MGFFRTGYALSDFTYFVCENLRCALLLCFAPFAKSAIMHAQMNDASHHDITGTIDLSTPADVAKTVHDILSPRYGHDWDGAFLVRVFSDTARAYAGEYEGLLPCDTPYHDLFHAFDSALATARLIDGWERSREEKLGPRLALLGVVLAVLHDIGFLRRPDEAAIHGASLLPVHETRSVAFARRYLADSPLADLAPLASLISVTQLDSASPDLGTNTLHRVIAQMVGTGDLVSQFADRYYLEKCRDFLYTEFVEAGIASAPGSSYPGATYTSSEDLLRKTPDFFERYVDARLENELGGVYHTMSAHFGDSDPYREAYEKNRAYLERVIEVGDFALLLRWPQPLYFTA